MARLVNSLCFCLLLLKVCGAGSALGAEDAAVLLTIDGDLIGLIDPTDSGVAERDTALQLTQRYYELLPPAARSQVEALHRQIMRLIPDFEVAYAAADSAEITHVMSEIDLRLAALQEIFDQQYTQEVAGLLHQAYQLILPPFGDG